MSKYTWRELERADMDIAAAHAFDMEYRAEQIVHEVQKRLARMEHIVDGLGEVKGEIVRCRDCEYYEDYTGCCTRRDNIAPMAATPDGFCAWGERNDGKAGPCQR